jgi:hypothetical protein
MVKTMMPYPLQYEASRDDPLFKPRTRSGYAVSEEDCGCEWRRFTRLRIPQIFDRRFMIAHDLDISTLSVITPTNEVRDGSFRRIR